MAASILKIIITLAPLLGELGMMILGKAKDRKEAKEKMISYLESIEDDIPVSLYKKHQAQIKRLKERLKNEKAA